MRSAKKSSKRSGFLLALALALALQALGAGAAFGEGFGIKAFDAQISDAAGNALTQAAAHPNQFTTSFDINTYPNPDSDPFISGKPEPVEDLKDATVSLPAGFVGAAAGVPQCTATELANGVSVLDVRPLCPEASQIGVMSLRVDLGEESGIPVFNMVPPPGVPARFGFNIAGDLVMLDSKLVRGGEGGYHLTTTASNIQQGIAFYGNTFTFWGVPSDPSHDSLRHCAGTGSTGCASPAPPKAFFRNPTSCTPTPDTGLTFGLHADSWQSAGVFSDASVRTHQPPGYPEPPEAWGEEVGIEGCEEVPFEPTISAQPSTDAADSPSGLSVDIGLPDDCWTPKATALEAEEATCQADLRDSVVTLPQGMSLNPAAAGGREGCAPAQVGLTSPLGSSPAGPAEFDEAPASCPNGSKIGAVAITTPLLDHPLNGFLYLAKQGQNPFNSLVSLYLIAEGEGVRIKQAAQIALGKDGQLTTTFTDIPQTPVSKIHFELYGGPRATLRTPPACGTYTTRATLTPWSGNAPVDVSAPFTISRCGTNGFDPKLAAGTQNPLAGAFSPFSLRLSREDGTQELSSLRLAVPPGLVASLKGIPYCPDAVLNSFPTEAGGEALLGSGAAEIAAPRCPAASQVGTVTTGAGAGPNPFYTQAGRAYWAGPYKGAPVSLAAVVPAVAGPFDLGNVVVRNGFEVDPESARITAVSDPFPQVLHGIGLDLRDIRLNLDRPDYTLNPTSCEPLSFDAEITSTAGTRAQRSDRFQAASCDRLAFKPRLSLRLSGATNRGAHPALKATLKMPRGGANLAGAVVALPHSEFLDQAHIGTVCTRVQFAAGAGGGAQCPPRSIYGHATAYSPILGYYLKGNAYLRSSSHKLPDLVLGLHGPPSQPIVIAAVGRIDSTKGGGIRTSFESVPDVPVSKVVLSMRGAKKGLLQNSTDICQGAHRANAAFTAHNGDRLQARPELVAQCGPKGKHGKKHR